MTTTPSTSHDQVLALALVSLSEMSFCSTYFETVGWELTLALTLHPDSAAQASTAEPIAVTSVRTATSELDCCPDITRLIKHVNRSSPNYDEVRSWCVAPSSGAAG